jgi:diguanylate cyclase (GGDEF)-like protein
MLDIDLFKNINDTYGHLAGDEVLVQIAARCQNCLRADDIICRYGGEEFLMLLADLKHKDLRIIAERIRVAIQSKKIIASVGAQIPVTVSIGGYSFASAKDTDIDFIVGQADSAMYLAKANGRNQVYIKTDD